MFVMSAAVDCRDANLADSALDCSFPLDEYWTSGFAGQIGKPRQERTAQGNRAGVLTSGFTNHA